MKDAVFLNKKQKYLLKKLFHLQNNLSEMEPMQYL